MLTQDLRYGWRVLVRTPGFTAIAVLTLGVGIGATITIFSLMNAVLLRPLAKNEPERVMRITGRLATGSPVSRFSVPDFRDFRERSSTMADRFKSVEIAPGTLAAGDQRRLAGVFLSLLFGLVVLVLLVACANVGNLLLARVLARRRELAIRLALGAGRARLARMIFTESAIVAGAGGAFALVVSIWTSRAFASITRCRPSACASTSGPTCASSRSPRWRRC